MNTRRFAFDRRPGAASRPKAREFRKWIRVSDLSSAVRSYPVVSGQKKIFAIVAPPMPADVGCKTIRRILIFDNHPDSLRLLSKLHVRPDDLAATRRAHPVYLIFALLLMLRFRSLCFGRSSSVATHSEEGAINISPVASQNLANAP